MDRVAHHVRGFNAHSIGIELVNRGRFPDWYHSARQDWPEPYAEPQIESLLVLLAYLNAELPALVAITGHDRLDLERVPATDRPDQTVRRKTDPGPGFPWPRVIAGCGLEFLPGPP